MGTTPECPANASEGNAMDNETGGLNNEFIFDACHKHWHYKDYATYTVVPETASGPGIGEVKGRKNGFCLLDSFCGRGATEKYTCEYQGITAGCYDEYPYELNC